MWVFTHTCTQRGQKDKSAPASLHLHRTRKRLSVGISGSLLIHHMNDLLHTAAHVWACLYSTLPSFLSVTHTHTRSSTFHLLFIVLHTCKHKYADTHISICCQTIAHCPERVVDYYFIALHWQKVNPFPSIPRWPMCRLWARDQTSCWWSFCWTCRVHCFLWLAVIEKLSISSV